MQLRPYQREAINGLYEWFGRETGNPLLVLPTAAGKSVIQATFVKEALEYYPSTRILMVSHVKELLEQNTHKLLSLWPEAPVGIYSAGLGRRDVGHPITVAGIQSVHARAMELGIFDLIIVDECHLIPASGDGMYRRFMADQHKINPQVKIIGMTATPYRMKTGTLHEGEDALFDGIAYEVGVRRLIDEGYLCNIVSKNGAVRADLSEVGTRGGEFIPGQLAYAMDKAELTRAAVDEITVLCENRRAWLLFCTGIDHAHHVAKEIQSRGIECGTITSETNPDERAHMLERFKSGHLRAITNCDVLTTGTDAPICDALMMLRPTKSIGLYVQIAGRVMRLYPGKINGLVLDYAGNVERHGPIDKIRVKSKVIGGGASGAPVKECPKCQTLVLIAVMVCPDCGHEWEAKLPHAPVATFAEIMAARHAPKIETIPVRSVIYRRHMKDDKPDSVCVEYVAGIRTFREWVCFGHGGYARTKAVQWWDQRKTLAALAPISADDFFDQMRACESLLKVPSTISVNFGQRHPEITGCEFGPTEATQEIDDFSPFEMEVPVKMNVQSMVTDLDDDIPF